MKNKFYFPFMVLMAAILVASAVSASAAEAHRLNVFAWLKGDQVVVECNFGENRPARDAAVSVLDSVTNQTLARGTTNDNGVFTFKVPQIVRQGHGLSIDVNAGMGHGNIWHMDAAELYEAAALTAGFEEAAIKGQTGGQPAAPTAAESAPAAPAMPAGKAKASSENLPLPDQAAAPSMAADIFGGQEAHVEHVRKVVREELENHRAELRRAIAKASTDEPTFAEIVGGIGWIVGIVGIILYLKSRRRNETGANS